MTTCNFCAKYSFQCVVNTARKRRGPRPRVQILILTFGLQKKQLKTVTSPSQYTSPTHTIEDELNRRDAISMSSTVSDHEEYGDSPPITWERDRDESPFIGFLGQLSSIEFDLQRSYPIVFIADSVGELMRLQRLFDIVLP